MEKKSLLLESLVITERDYEVHTSNFHGRENIHKGEAAQLSLQNWFLSFFQNLFLLGFVQQWGSLSWWHNQTTTSKWVNIQKYNKQPLVATYDSIWEVMLILKKRQTRFGRQNVLSPIITTTFAVLSSSWADLIQLCWSTARQTTFYCAIFTTRLTRHNWVIFIEVETRTWQFDHHRWMVAVADRWKGQSVKMQRGTLFFMSLCREPISTAPCTDLFVVWTHWKLTAFLFHFNQHDNLSLKTLRELALDHIKKLTLISKRRQKTLSMKRKEYFLFFHY